MFCSMKRKKALSADNNYTTTQSKNVSSGHDGEENEAGASQGSNKQLSQEEYAVVKKRKKENNTLRKVSSAHDGEEHQVGASQGSSKRLSQEEYAVVKKRKKENNLLSKVSSGHEGKEHQDRPSQDFSKHLTQEEYKKQEKEDLLTKKPKELFNGDIKDPATQSEKPHISPLNCMQISSGHDEEVNWVGTSKGSSKHLSQKEYAEVLKRKKQKDLAKKEWPKIFVIDQGRTSSLSNDSDRMPLFMCDIQGLLLFSLLGMKSPVFPRWIKGVNITKVSHVVMVHIEGVGLGDIKTNTQSLLEGSTTCAATNSFENETRDCQGGNPAMGNGPSLTEGTKVDAGKTDNRVSSSGGLPDWLKNILPRTSHHMSHALELVSPSIHDACPTEALTQVNIGEIAKRVFGEDKWEMKTKNSKPSESFFKFLSITSPSSDDKLHPNDKFSRLKLLLKVAELARNNFPLPLPGKKGSSNKEFVFTSDNYEKVTSSSPMFGLDCEMCLTSVDKLELTSISIVNEKLELVYHTLVLPYNSIRNFLTKFSGITPQMLQNVTKRLKHVQQDLRKLLPPDAILVGHSLDSDLSALKMMHPYVIDSSLAYNLSGGYGKRSSLKALCQFFLNEKIQTAGEGGHDPTEDAISSLKLIQFKLQNDEAYGNVMMGWEPHSASSSGWQASRSHTRGCQQQETKKDSTQNTKEQQPQQNDNTSSDEAIQPFKGNYLNIFQVLKSCNVAIVTTEQGLKKYLPVLGSLEEVPSVEVFSDNKQVSQRARDVVASFDLTYVHLEMGKKLSQCPDKATHQRQIIKLDKRLQRIHKGAAPKSIHIYVFSGSSLMVPCSKRSNGFVLVGIKDMPFRM